MFRQNGNYVYNYLELVCSKKADVTDILTEYSDAAAGSICYCIESKTKYMLNPERTAWMPITNTDTEDQVAALSQTVDDLSSDLSDLSTKVLYVPETKNLN